MATLASITLGTWDYALIVSYLIFVIGVGAAFSRREENTSEFLLGGRRMPWWAIGISYFASLMSAHGMVSTPGEAFSYGITMSLQTLIYPFVLIGTFFLFVRFYFRIGAFTPFVYLEQRFDRRVRCLASIVYLWTRLMYLATVLFASAKIFEGAAGWPIWVTIVTVGLVSIAYTSLGGMKAVVWTDFAQFIILSVGLGLVTFKCATGVEGGVVSILQYAFEHERGFTGFSDPYFFSFSPYVRLSFWYLLVQLVVSCMFYHSADQIVIQRLLSTGSYESAKKSLYMNAILIVPYVFCLWFLGLALFAFYAHHPSEAVGITGDTALFRFIATQLPSPVPGLIVAAVLAAAMSTLDSGMNSLAAVATKDIYVLLWRRDASEHEQVAFSRAMTVCIGLFAILGGLLISSVAKGIGETIMETALIWGSLTSTLAIVFLIGVTSRRASATHVLVALCISWVATGVGAAWYWSSQGGAHSVSFMFVPIPSLITMVVLGYLPGIFSRPVAREKTEGLTYPLNR